jgi:hypothetical protein
MKTIDTDFQAQKLSAIIRGALTLDHDPAIEAAWDKNRFLIQEHIKAALGKFNPKQPKDGCDYVYRWTMTEPETLQLHELYLLIPLLSTWCSVMGEHMNIPRVVYRMLCFFFILWLAALLEVPSPNWQWDDILAAVVMSMLAFVFAMKGNRWLWAGWLWVPKNAKPTAEWADASFHAPLFSWAIARQSWC